MLLALAPLAASAATSAGEMREAARRMLEDERRAHLYQSTEPAAKPEAGNALPDLPGAPDGKAPDYCHAARASYASHCGSAFAPRWGSRRCAEAQMLERQSCAR